jgi:hypothetical protein
MSQRLFGVRGGGVAYEAERHSVSLLDVELAAGEETDVTDVAGTPEPAVDGS